MERNKERVSCAMCSMTVAASYLKSYMLRSHGICILQTRGVDEVGVGSTTYVLSSSKVIQEVRFPVPGCLAVAHSAGRLRKNFMFHQFISKVAVVQEDKDTLPCCDMCIMHMPAGRIIRHRRTAKCDMNTQMRWSQQDVAVTDKCSDAVFSLIGENELERIKGVECFNYLRRLLDWSNNNSPAILCNIRKAR